MKIKFRAKVKMPERPIARKHEVPEGQWVYGEPHTIDCPIPHIHTVDVGKQPIAEETICQFTGLYDKNGKEIYEGDILRYTRYNVRGEGIHNETWVHECIVYWDEEKHAFWHSMKLSCGSCSGLLIFKDKRAEKEEIEVIGNIHDNPELMEGGKR